MKVLTSCYDINQGTMNPANFSFLAGIHPDWMTAGWPVDIIRQANGDWRHGCPSLRHDPTYDLGRRRVAKAQPICRR
jgi:hypothetical protein